MKKHSFWMTVSGVMGFSFFLIANFTTVFVGLNVVAAFIQIAINAFVFVAWLRGYRASPPGFKKLVAFIGTIFPPIMMSITIYRVLVPFFFK